MPTDEHPAATRSVDRRTVLRTAGAGAALLAGTAAGQGGAGGRLHRGYHDATQNLIDRSLVVYAAPSRAESPVCEFDAPWEHPVVAPGTPTADAVYAALFVDRRFEPGTVVAVVDRIQGCERDGTRYTGVFGEVVAEPPGPAGEGDGEPGESGYDRLPEGTTL